MNRYEIVLQSDKVLPDDELKDTIERAIMSGNFEEVINTDFEVLSAINLEGTRKEVMKDLAIKILANHSDEDRFVEDSILLSKYILGVENEKKD